ncbi:hypothetical protein C9374_012869 [Naegleria lovaniensis]|uniref:RGS domain-containing protein n=1 Tax=Naegleria lovaniensis TaxID=51637 RepID=A0AA88GCL6_NAELO|nr:uncharacterized protein C9374_012869 [Naegleria lovaniensis]KAG2373137.1 hypothetical protein C9374_012869 [Naegleria lovaniensis]
MSRHHDTMLLVATNTPITHNTNTNNNNTIISNSTRINDHDVHTNQDLASGNFPRTPTTLPSSAPTTRTPTLKLKSSSNTSSTTTTGNTYTNKHNNDNDLLSELNFTDIHTLSNNTPFGTLTGMFTTSGNNTSIHPSQGSSRPIPSRQPSFLPSIATTMLETLKKFNKSFPQSCSLAFIIGLIMIISTLILLILMIGAISISLFSLLNQSMLIHSRHGGEFHSQRFSSSLISWIWNSYILWLNARPFNSRQSGFPSIFNSLNMLQANNDHYTDNSTFYTLDEKFTHCRVFPQTGQGRAILQWKFLDEQSFSNYTPLSNNKEASKGPIIRMRLVIGETPSNIYTYPKLFAFAKSVTSLELKKLLKNEMDELGDQYQYFFNQELDSTSSIKMIHFLNQSRITLHTSYMDGLPTFYLSRNNVTQQPYLQNVTGSTITEIIIPNDVANNNTNYPDAICNDGDDVALLPLFKKTRIVSANNNTKKAQSYCSYYHALLQTGGCYITYEKRLNSILTRSNTSTYLDPQSNDENDASSLKFVVFFVSHHSANFLKNITSPSEQAKFFASLITSQNPEVFYLAHEVDFSKDYYDMNCDYYVSLYSISPMEFYNYWRAIRHVCLFLYSMMVAGFLLFYKNKQPIKSRILISGLSVVACLIFSIVGCVSDFNFFNYDGIEYSFYITLAVLYLISMCRYLFVRNLYRVVKVVDGLEDVKFNDEKKVRHFKKRLEQLYALSKLASVRFFGAVVVILVMLFNIPTPVFVWILNDTSIVPDDVKNFFLSAIVYLKMISLVIGFILPGFCTIFIDLTINRKWIFNPVFEFFKSKMKIDKTSNHNSSAQTQYMKQVQASTTTFISPTSGIIRYFSSYDDPLAYRLEFITSTIIALILGFSTFGVGLIQIPNWRVIPKITLLSVHGTLYLLFEMSYVLLTCGFIVMVQLVSERKKANTKKLFFSSNLSRTRDASTKLLMDTIADVTGDGRNLIYRFCCSEFSLENLLFYEKVTRVIEQVKEKKYEQDANVMNKAISDMYNSFIASSGCLEISIQSELKSKVTHFIHSIDYVTTDDASSISSANKRYLIFKDGVTYMQSNHKIALALCEILESLRETALLNLHDTFSRLITTKAFKVYFDKRETEKSVMKRAGIITTQDSNLFISLRKESIELADIQQDVTQPPTMTSHTTLTSPGISHPQETLVTSVLKQEENPDEILLTDENVVYTEDEKHSRQSESSEENEELEYDVQYNTPNDQ